VFELSATDREAFTFFRGNIAAVFRARTAAIASDDTAAGVPIPQFLRDGWARIHGPSPLPPLRKSGPLQVRCHEGRIRLMTCADELSVEMAVRSCR